MRERQCNKYLHSGRKATDIAARKRLMIALEITDTGRRKIKRAIKGNL